MDITIHGKQMDVGDALSQHVEDKISEINQKYFNHAAFATITFAKEGHGKLVKAHIHIQMGKNIMIMADATEADPYVAFDAAAEKAAKQLRRYKRKLRDHHDRLEQTPESEFIKARDYVIAAMPEGTETANDDKNAAENGEGPVIIAEMATNIQTMSVSEAVMRMDLSGQTALLFRNASHNELNMVYRRPDGNVGWIDPEAQLKVAKK